MKLILTCKEARLKHCAHTNGSLTIAEGNAVEALLKLHLWSALVSHGDTIQRHAPSSGHQAERSLLTLTIATVCMIGQCDGLHE